MRLRAVTRIGLKSPNSLSHDIPSVLRRTVNVSERVLRVSIKRQVCYSRRPFSKHSSAVIPCTFGLFPEFSTPVEKTVENRGVARDATDSGPKYRDFWPSPVRKA